MQLRYRSMVFKSFLSLFSFARVDLKNIGNEENDLIFDAPSGSDVKIPQWFQDGNGIGYQLESDSQFLRFSVVCHGDGELKIWLRGLDVRDSQGRRMPLYVDYTYFALNDEVLLNNPITVCHDKFVVASQKVKNGEQYTIELHWQPHGYPKKEFVTILDELLENHDMHHSLTRMAKLRV